MMTTEEFASRVRDRDMPTNPVARIEVLARELAEGSAENLWPADFDGLAIRTADPRMTPYSAAFHAYFAARWGSWQAAPALQLLVSNGFLVPGTNRVAKAAPSVTTPYALTKAAFALLDRAEPARVFISYKRSESSAFALLLHGTLARRGLAPFLDMQLSAGSDWRGVLQSRVCEAEYVILLLAPETLKSRVTLQEIEWALNADTTIVPLWHRGFCFRAEEWPELPPHIRDALAGTHTIRVLEENPPSYDTAIRALLNRFGLVN